MCGDDDDFFGFLGAGDFRDHVIDGERARAEVVLKIELNDQVNALRRAGREIVVIALADIDFNILGVIREFAFAPLVRRCRPDTLVLRA